MVEYSVVHLLAGVVGLAFLGNTYLIVSRGRESLTFVLTSAAVGAGLVFVAVWPDSFELVGTFLGLEAKTHAILVVANLVLFALVIYLLNRIGRLRNRVSRLNEQLSLVRAEAHEDDD